MPGSFDFAPDGASPGGFALQSGVFFYDPGAGYSLIPNVQCIDVQNRDGHEPSSARFSYILDDRAAAMGLPSQFDQLWPLNSPNPDYVGQYVVSMDDRIAVLLSLPDGSTQVMFDGFARLPQIDVSGSQQVVTFSAVSAEIRCWDFVIKGRVQRNGDPTNIAITDGSQDFFTHLPTRFNPANSRYPSGQGNSTPNGANTGQGDSSVAYPVFVDPNIDRPTSPNKSPSFWSLSEAVLYFLGVHNSLQLFVANPDFSLVSSLLDNRRPLPGLPYFDPSNPSTYRSSPIVVRDYDATNMAWPEAMERLLGYYGFGMRWLLGQDGNGFPVHSIDIYRKDAANADAPVFAYMQSPGNVIDPSQSNAEQMSGSFDFHGVSNEYIIETHPNRWEVSVVLAPLFVPVAGDETKENRPQFDRTALAGATAEIRARYRDYGVDECGDGFYDFVNGFTINQPFDFSDLWPKITLPNGNKVTAYVVRYRPGRRDCLADDGNGDVYRSQLALSRDYAGKYPAVWDKTGTWQPISGGDWELMEDRLGIRFTSDNPEEIKIGEWTNRGAANVQNSGSVLKGIKSIANPGTNAKTDTLFYLRLTTVIEADNGIEARARRRPASPLGNIIQRRIDAKDHYRRDKIHKSSAFFNSELAVVPAVPRDRNGNLIVRDDTQAAYSQAGQLRTAHEFPALPLAITIPGISFAYAIGDRISLIAGRNVSLQTNVGTEQGEAASYPFVVGISYEFSGESQRTTLQLSDRRMEPQPIEHRRGH